MNAPLVEEAVVTSYVNDVLFAEWRCTPADLDALVIGRLFIDGIIASANDARLRIDKQYEGGIRIDAQVDARAADRPDRTALPIPGTEVFIDLFRELFNGVDARHESGGMHAAAATDGLRISAQVEDVGRHNTIDKIVGRLLLDGLTIHGHGLLTSSRVSGEIASKAARAGFAWLASRSIPTTLAVQLARAAHMPIIGRAPGKNAFVY